MIFKRVYKIAQEHLPLTIESAGRHSTLIRVTIPAWVSCVEWKHENTRVGWDDYYTDPTWVFVDKKCKVCVGQPNEEGVVDVVIYDSFPITTQTYDYVDEVPKPRVSSYSAGTTPLPANQQIVLRFERREQEMPISPSKVVSKVAILGEVVVFRYLNSEKPSYTEHHYYDGVTGYGFGEKEYYVEI